MKDSSNALIPPFTLMKHPSTLDFHHVTLFGTSSAFLGGKTPPEHGPFPVMSGHKALYNMLRRLRRQSGNKNSERTFLCQRKPILRWPRCSHEDRNERIDSTPIFDGLSGGNDGPVPIPYCSACLSVAHQCPTARLSRKTRSSSVSRRRPT